MIINFGNLGCIAIIFFLVTMLLAFRYAHIILVIAILWYISNKVNEFINLKKEEKAKNYKSKTGKVYKQCTFCGSKADRLSERCANCGKSFE